MSCEPFNLSILECKFVGVVTAKNYVRLLISPYWNVNRNLESGLEIVRALLISPYWNVNKIRAHRRSDTLDLLISPYWNVNSFVCILAYCRFALLISPYWNVNLSVYPGQAASTAF